MTTAVRSVARLAVAEALLDLVDEEFNAYDLGRSAGLSGRSVRQVLDDFQTFGWVTSRLEPRVGESPTRRLWRVVASETLREFHQGVGRWTPELWRPSDMRRRGTGVGHVPELR